MQRPQKTAKVGYPCEGMLETESNKGACSVAQLETERQDGAVYIAESNGLLLVPCVLTN